MLDPRFVILGGVIAVYGCVVYALDTLKGNTKPNRVSWLMWAIAPLIAFAAELAQGVGWPAVMPFAIGFGPVLVFAASFVDRKAYWKVSRFDLACGLLSALALALWAVTKSGNVAIIFSILADALAAVPTIIKAYHFPDTEHAAPFVTSAISAVITLLTIDSWTFANYGFPVYILLIASSISALILFPNLRLHSIKA